MADAKGAPLPRVALLVEDDRVLREALAGMMRDDGFEVIEAPTLGLARRWLASRPVGVVVLDLTLTDGDGEPLIEELKTMAKAPALVVISASATRAQRIADDYAVPYVVKPIDVAVAETTISVAYEREMRPQRRHRSGRRPRTGG